jgi:hypothetical protein
MKTQHLIPVLLLAAFCCGCGVKQQAAPPPAPAANTLVSDPVAAIKGILPKGVTVLAVKEHTSPFYLAKGDGTQIVAGVSGEQDPSGKSRVLFQIWIMPPDYEGGAGDLGRGAQQTVPPRLLATGKNGKVYAWGLTSDLHDTLIKALFK